MDPPPPPPPPPPSNTTNFDIINIRNNQDPLFSIPGTSNYTTNPTASIPNLRNYGLSTNPTSNPNTNIISNPSSVPSSSSQPPPRASKKRTRASRKVPTTVLTTDISNFRSMVQEFTGLPAQPFSSFYDNANAPDSNPNLLIPPLPLPRHNQANTAFISNSSLHQAIADNFNASAATTANFGGYHNMLFDVNSSNDNNFMINVGGGPGGSNQFGDDVRRLMGGTSTNDGGDRDRDHDDDDSGQEKRRKSVIDSWNNIQ